MGYVYKITNTVNGKAYIGISVNEPEKRRIKDHLSGRGNRIIARAIKKYGKDAFTYEILEDNVFPELLPDLEVAYIAQFNTVVPHGYNLTYGGEGGGSPSAETRRKLSDLKGEKHPNFGKKFSVEHRRKISESKKGEKNPQFGKPLSVEHRHKISEAQKGEKNHSFGKTHSKEHRRKISEGLKGEKHPQFGKPHSAETRQKISEGLKGKPLSVEHRRKISEGLKGEKHPQFGKPRSSETRRKISEGNKGNKNRLHPDHIPARDFFFSLPSDMPLKSRRKLLYTTFRNVNRSTLRRWTYKWLAS